MKIAQIARALGVPIRLVKYAVERVPPDVVPEDGEGRGIPRRFAPAAAFHLAVVVQLLAGGVSWAPALEAAARVRRALARACPGRDGFDPFRGQFETLDYWGVALGGDDHDRVLHSGAATGDAGWQRRGKASPGYAPHVEVRVDVSRIAGALARAGD